MASSNAEPVTADAAFDADLILDANAEDGVGEAAISTIPSGDTLLIEAPPLDTPTIATPPAVTNNTTPTLTGTGQAGSTITLSDTSSYLVSTGKTSQAVTKTVALGTTTVLADGTWSFTVGSGGGPVLLTERTAFGEVTDYTFSATAGEVGYTSSDTVTSAPLDLDVTAPTVVLTTPSATDAAPATIDGSIAIDMENPAIDSDVGLTITVTDAVTYNGQTTTTQSIAKEATGGTFSVPFSQTLGIHVITASATDQAGNVGSSAPITITLNHAPLGIGIDAVGYGAGNILSSYDLASGLVVYGTTTVAAPTAITLELDGLKEAFDGSGNDLGYQSFQALGPTFDAVLNGNGTWGRSLPTVDLDQLTSGSTYRLDATVSDGISSTATAQTFVVDTPPKVISSAVSVPAESVLAYPNDYEITLNLDQAVTIFGGLGLSLELSNGEFATYDGLVIGNKPITTKTLTFDYQPKDDASSDLRAVGLVGANVIDANGLNALYAFNQDLGVSEIADPGSQIVSSSVSVAAGQALTSLNSYAITLNLNEAVTVPAGLGLTLELSNGETATYVAADSSKPVTTKTLTFAYRPQEDTTDDLHAVGLTGASVTDAIGNPVLGTFDHDLGVGVALPAGAVATTADSGPGSLRAAITYANAHPGTTITFLPSLAGKTITLQSDLPEITGNNTVINGGNAGITIDGGGQYRPFFVGDSVDKVAATIENLTVANGHAQGGNGGGGSGTATGGGGGGLGGGVFVASQASLTIDNLTFAGNSATGGNGGSTGAVPTSLSDDALGYGGGGGLGGAGGMGAPTTSIQLGQADGIINALPNGDVPSAAFQYASFIYASGEFIYGSGTSNVSTSFTPFTTDNLYPVAGGGAGGGGGLGTEADGAGALDLINAAGANGLAGESALSTAAGYAADGGKGGANGGGGGSVTMGNSFGEGDGGVADAAGGGGVGGTSGSHTTEFVSTGGTGGFGGGGGGGSSVGGDGGFGGGGGAGTIGGNGGFGGGGGGGLRFEAGDAVYEEIDYDTDQQTRLYAYSSPDYFTGGDGDNPSFTHQFYPYYTATQGGAGGFGGGAGTGTNAGYTNYIDGVGGGGLGAGGSLFVTDGGSLTVDGTLNESNGSVTGGTSTDAANDGDAYGAGLFLQGASGTVTFAPGIGQTQTISDAIADEVGNGGIAIDSRGIVKGGAGTLTLSGLNSYSGGTTINGGTLDLASNDAAGTGAITFGLAGGTLVLEAGVNIANQIINLSYNDKIVADASNKTLKGLISSSIPGGSTLSETSDGFGGEIFQLVAQKAEDGYIAGGTVSYVSGPAGTGPVETDGSGNFTLSGGTGPIELTGGTDTATGLLFTGTLEAPNDSAILSPLTTVVEALIAANTAETEAQAETDVVNAFGLATGTDLNTLDAVAAAQGGNTAVFQAGAEIINAVTLIAAAGGTASAAYTAIAALVTAGGTVDLAKASTISAIGQAAGLDATTAAAVANTVSQAEAAISTQTFAAITAVSTIVQGKDATAFSSIAQSSASPAQKDAAFTSAATSSDNLLTNGDFSSGAAGFTATGNYTLLMSGSAEYMTAQQQGTTTGDVEVVTNPQTAFGQNQGRANSYNSYGDHTTGAGQMLFVDGNGGSAASSAFWSESGISVAADTQYTFSYFVNNADTNNADDVPRIQVALDGVAVGNITEAAVPSLDAAGRANWQQVTDSFTTTGAIASATVSLLDINGGAPDNDFTIDDVSLDANPVTAPVSDNLILNGDFSDGAADFTTSGNYTLITPGSTEYSTAKAQGSNVGDVEVITNPNTDFAQNQGRANSYNSYGDHTTGTGEMLFVDGNGGSAASSAFWSQSGISLAANTQYTFSYFVNVADKDNIDDVPRIQFALNGTAVGNVTEAAAPSLDATGGANWQEVTDSFTTTSAVGSAVVSLVDLNGGGGENDFTIDDIALVAADNPACYCRGTRILTASGEVSVEDLAIGDWLVTASGEVMAIKWIGTRSYAGRFANTNPGVLPICFKVGSLGESVPARDLWVSPKHAMLLDGVLIPAEHLVNGTSIIQAISVNLVDYFHIELDNHDVIVAEGAASETFIDDDSRAMFHNARDFAALYHDAAPADPIYCAPRVEDGFALEAVRRRLLARAGSTGARQTPRAA